MGARFFAIIAASAMLYRAYTFLFLYKDCSYDSKHLLAIFLQKTCSTVGNVSTATALIVISLFWVYLVFKKTSCQ